VNPIRILVVNVNTTRSATDAMVASAQLSAGPGVELVGLTPVFGADGVDTQFESLLASVAVMDSVVTYSGSYDAVVVAGFGEHGREGLQELVEVPVLDVAESAAHLAMMLGRRYSVITTLDRSIGAIEDRLLVAGLSAHCASVRAAGLGTRALDDDPEAAFISVRQQADAALRADRAEVICLGCGGMAGWEVRLSAELGVPVIDGIAAAVSLAESLVRLGLRTSKIGSCAPPEVKPIAAWPLSEHLQRP
jgi:allantoin racemase